jgi:hypothetical protein
MLTAVTSLAAFKVLLAQLPSSSGNAALLAEVSTWSPRHQAYYKCACQQRSQLSAQ